MKVLLEDYTWPEVKTLITRDPVVVVPVGAVEQHGRHLPLRVDATLCQDVARRAAELAIEDGTPTVLTPTVWAGYSPHHMDFPGTITLSSNTFMSVVTDVTLSLRRHGFRRILLLNGHGGNANLLRSIVQTLRFEHDTAVAAASYWDFAVDVIRQWRRSPLGGINHACEMETSLMLAVRPDLVDMNQAQDTLVDRDPHLASDLVASGVVTCAGPFKEVTRTGVIGQPTLADAQRGEELISAIATRIKTFIVSYQDRGALND